MVSQEINKLRSRWLPDSKPLFPKPSFRKYQKETLEKCDSFLNSNNRGVILLEAPTGFGKSPVNLALARTFKSSFYITPQKMLQDQIICDFNFVEIIKGRSNYPCLMKKGRTCDIGPCKALREYKCPHHFHGLVDGVKVDVDDCLYWAAKNVKVDVDDCLYWAAKKQAYESQIALMNFSYFLYEDLTPEGTSRYKFGDRDLLIVDEAHNIDAHILDMVSITISDRTLTEKIFTSTEVQNGISNLNHNRVTRDDFNSFIKMVRTKCIEAVDMLEEYDKSIQETCDLDNLKKFIWTCKEFLDDPSEWVDTISEYKYKEQTVKHLRLEPLYVRGYGDKFLWNRARFFIISSATLFGDRLIKELGSPFSEDEILKIDVPSTFPVPNRRIFDYSIGKLTRDCRDNNLHNTIRAIDQIISLPECRSKGLIHCHSYQNLQYLRQNYEYNPRFVFHNSDDREDTLRSWLNSDPAKGKILVSVAMTEGLDLKDDLCRFQICFKCPYPDLSNKRTYRRTVTYKDYPWYNTQALITLVQTYGRAVRHEEDWALFFFLDSSVTTLCTKLRKKLPNWFLQAWDKREYGGNP